MLGFKKLGRSLCLGGVDGWGEAAMGVSGRGSGGGGSGGHGVAVWEEASGGGSGGDSRWPPGGAVGAGNNHGYELHAGAS